MAIADQSKWALVLTDMSGNTALGGPVVNTSQKLFSYHLNAGKTMQFTMNIDNPRSNFVMTQDSLLKVYRKNRVGAWGLQMVGDVIHAEESAQGDIGVITVVAADPWWRLQRRLLGMGTDSLGRGTGFTVGTSTSTVDIGAILFFILANLNSTFNTGVAGGTLQTSTSSYVGPVYSQAVGDLLQQLFNTLGAPDFEIVPNEPSGSMPATIIGTMNVWAALGTTRPNTIFEYGTGRHNVANYDRLLSKDGLANQLFSPPQGFPDLPASGDNMVMEQDTTSQAAIGLYQDIAQGDLTSIPLRHELCLEYLAIRKFARQQIIFTPTVDCPLDYTLDYNVGDIVTSRAFVNGGYRYNGTTRIYGVDLSVDDNDAETPALTLIPS